MRAAVSDVSRLATIARVLAKHGFSAIALRAGVNTPETQRGATETTGVDPRRNPADTARRLRGVLEDLGPTFVKVGQILSTRPDVLPPPFIQELATLQDSAPTLPFDQIREAIEAGLGASVDALFRDLSEEPLASASMAQTHLATLHDGTRVVVKVQRPGIAETMRADLDLLHIFAKLLEVTIQEMDLYAPADVVATLDDALSAELDFLHEAQNLERFAANFADDENVSVPRLYRDRSCKTVMTMALVKGTKIGALEPDTALARKMASSLIDSLYRQIFHHGFFHGDPHPGNLFTTEDERLAYIDFGLCGHLSVHQREHLVTLIISISSGDIDGIARILLRMGRPTGHVSMARFKREVSTIRERYLRGTFDQIDVGAFLDEVFDAAARYHIRVAPEYSILAKAAVTIEGVIRRLAPSLDLIESFRPYGRRLLTEHYSADRLLKGSISSVISLGNFLSEVPDQLGQVLMDVEGGHLTIRVRNEAIEGIGRELNLQTTRIFMALCAAALIIATPMWYVHEPYWIWNERIPVFTTFSALTAFSMIFWGIVWHIFGGRTRDLRVKLTPILRFFRRRQSGRPRHP